MSYETRKRKRETRARDVALVEILLSSTDLPRALVECMVVPMVHESYVILSDHDDYHAPYAACRCTPCASPDALIAHLRAAITHKYNHTLKQSKKKKKKGEITVHDPATALNFDAIQHEMNAPYVDWRQLWDLYHRLDVDGYEERLKEMIAGECIASWNEKECQTKIQFECDTPSNERGASTTTTAAASSNDADRAVSDSTTESESDAGTPFLVCYWSWVYGSIFSHKPVYGSRALRAKLLKQMECYCGQCDERDDDPDYKSLVQKFGPLTMDHCATLPLLTLCRMSVAIGWLALNEGDDTGMRAILRGIKCADEDADE